MCLSVRFWFACVLNTHFMGPKYFSFHWWQQYSVKITRKSPMCFFHAVPHEPYFNNGNFTRNWPEKIWQPGTFFLYVTQYVGGLQGKRICQAANAKTPKAAHQSFAPLQNFLCLTATCTSSGCGKLCCPCLSLHPIQTKKMSL